MGSENNKFNFKDKLSLRVPFMATASNSKSNQVSVSQPPPPPSFHDPAMNNQTCFGTVHAAASSSSFPPPENFMNKDNVNAEAYDVGELDQAFLHFLNLQAQDPSSSQDQQGAAFDVEYARWIEEEHRIICQLRNAVDDLMLSENELKRYVDACFAHYAQITHLNSMVAKSDVLHLVSGMCWTPVERCFIWIGGFRPSHLLKVIMSQLELLTEQQMLGMIALQQSTQEAEEALSQGMETLHHTISDIISSDVLFYPSNLASCMAQMAGAITNLYTLETFVRQMTYNCLMTDMKVYFQPRLAKIITLDSQPVDNQLGDMQQEDSQQVDSQKLDIPELEVVVEHKADHMLEQDIRRWVGTADQAATFAELEELTSVEDQISRLSCPSQPCVASITFIKISIHVSEQVDTRLR
nr:bZIP transcription factor TGA10-like isoform X3 [Ipomoea batatas]